MSELVADGIPVAVSRRVLQLARQPYYRWRTNPVTRRELDEAYRANALFDAHRDDLEFGYRLLADDARSESGEAMSDRTAWRIASENGWWSVFGKQRGKNGKRPGPAVHNDLCVVIDDYGRERHQFVADGPNQLWLTEITEHKTAEGKLYPCAVKDAFSRRTVGYSIDSRMQASLAVRAVRNAVAMRDTVNGCIVHSDTGSQFRSRKLRRELVIHNLVRSMGRVAPCGDAIILQPAAEERPRPASLGHPRGTAIAIATRIERTYHRRRRQARPGRLTPIEFETIMNEEQTLAA